MDFVTGLIAAFPFLAGLFGAGGGSDGEVGQLDPVLRQQLLEGLLSQRRQNVLVDPAAASFYGFDRPPADAVPLRAAANQLAFALLPNFVRPSNSLFPGTAPPFLQMLPPVGGDGTGNTPGVAFLPTPGGPNPAPIPGAEDAFPEVEGGENITGPPGDPSGIKIGEGVGVDFLLKTLPGITDEQIIAILNGENPEGLPEFQPLQVPQVSLSDLRNRVSSPANIVWS